MSSREICKSSQADACDQTRHSVYLVSELEECSWYHPVLPVSLFLLCCFTDSQLYCVLLTHCFTNSVFFMICVINLVTWLYEFIVLVALIILLAELQWLGYCFADSLFLWLILIDSFCSINSHNSVFAILMILFLLSLLCCHCLIILFILLTLNVLLTLFKLFLFYWLVLLFSHCLNYL